MAWLTIIAAFLIGAPMGVWLVGIGPHAMLLVNVSALVLTIRLYAIAAGIAEQRQHLLWVGLFSGMLGSLMSELLLHIGGTDNLATAFSAYASFGSELYRLDVLTWWWPFAFVGLSGAFYACLALFISHLVHYRRRLLGLPKEDITR